MNVGHKGLSLCTWGFNAPIISIFNNQGNIMQNMTVYAFERAYYLFDLARLHLEKWERNGDIKLLKIAHDLKVEAKLWLE
jgi:hypothetical protein